MSRVRALASLASAVAIFASAGNATAAEPLPGQYEGPPEVMVESRGHAVRAVMGSVCWLTQYDDGTGAGVCGDVGGPITSAPLPVRGKRIVHIDLGIPAENLTASLSERALRIRRGDPSGRYWALRLPKRLSAKSLLSLEAKFGQGSVPYGVTLRRAKR